MIPLPVSCLPREGEFALTPDTTVLADSLARSIGDFVRDSLCPATGFIFRPAEGEAANQIRIRIKPEMADLGPEGYQLDVAPDGVEICASGKAGAFYAVQSLRQLLPPEIFSRDRVESRAWRVKCVSIKDRPRFAWRGLMLDTARHFFPVKEIRRFLDHMALHKFNVFHWHLVDDQGWRLEIKRYPRLTEIGSRRAESPQKGNRNEGDGRPYGGFYTQEEAREIVRYAAQLFITVVPEIEMPGHSGAAIAAYPELGNRDIPGYRPEVRTRWGVNPYIYAPSEDAFAFLRNVLLEVMDIFPSEFIHVGGDEAPKDQWKQSPLAQEVIRRERLADEDALQSWFLRRMEEFLSGHGRRLIGWDEIQEGGLSPGATMMLWRDWKWARAALNAGNTVVMSPASHCYLDYSQGPIETEPECICGELTLEKTYQFEPVPEGIEPGADARILGIQGNVWTEYIRDRASLDYMTWPRAAALAEVGWSPKDSRNWDAFLARLSAHLLRLKQLGIGFRGI